jgi:hypothetical protein
VATDPAAHRPRLLRAPDRRAPVQRGAGGRSSPEATAERIPDARLRLYPDKGHAGVLTHRRAIGEIVAFLTAGDQPET